MKAVANAEFNAIMAALKELEESKKVAKTIQQHFREFMDARLQQIEMRKYTPPGDFFLG